MKMAIALMMEAASTSETSVKCYQTARRNNPEDSHLLDTSGSGQEQVAGFCEDGNEASGCKNAGHIASQE
jgi:hypothetical protein